MAATASLMENPFLKNDSFFGSKKIIRRPPIIIKETHKGTEGKMREVSNADHDTSSDSGSSIELEYGPGIVERLRAKFSRLSTGGGDSRRSKSVSCEDLLSDDEPSRALSPNGVSQPISKLSRRQSQSINDIMNGSEEIVRNGSAGHRFPSHAVHNDSSDVRLFIPRRVDTVVPSQLSPQNTTVYRPIIPDSPPEKQQSISDLRRRFESKGKFSQNGLAPFAAAVPKQLFISKPIETVTLPPLPPKQQQACEQQTETLNRQVLNLRKVDVEQTRIHRDSVSSCLSTASSVPTATGSEISGRVHQPGKMSTAKILNVLNDASSENEPEFVKLARRLRRFDPEVHDTNGTKVTIEPEKGSSSTAVFWRRPKPYVPELSPRAKIIRELPETSNVLPPDPHSARISKSPVPVIADDKPRRTYPADASPPPEEPSPSKFASTRQESFTNETTAYSSATDASFTPATSNNFARPLIRPEGQTIWSSSQVENNNKYRPAPIDTSTSATKNWSDATTNRHSEGVTLLRVGKSPAPLAPVQPQAQIRPNVVSISVRAPASHLIYKNYNDDASSSKASEHSTSSSQNGQSTTVHTPSSSNNFNFFASTPLRSTPQNNGQSKFTSLVSSVSPFPKTSPEALLSPRQKPYGDDVTILKSETPASESYIMENAIDMTAPNASAASINSDILVNEDSDSSEDEGMGRFGSFNLNARPTSLSMRIDDGPAVGGDGNAISRSVMSLVADEDLTEFLVALTEEPINVSFEFEAEPSTGILRDAQSRRNSRTGNRIRFSTAAPQAYTYFDEVTAVQCNDWNQGSIVDYQYFKDLEEAEAAEDERKLLMIQEWHNAIDDERGINGFLQQSSVGQNEGERIDNI